MARPSERECGSCAVCCVVAQIDELKKPANTPCEYQIESDDGCCGIVGDERRPKLCQTFYCSWMRGIGSDDDRPDQIGAMFSVNQSERGLIGFSVEVEADAVLTTARDMTIAYATTTKIPLIVVATTDADDDLGEVVVHKDIEEKAWAILGEHVADLSDDVRMFKRKIPEWQPSQSQPHPPTSKD